MTTRTVSFDNPSDLAAFANAAKKVTAAAVVDGGTDYALDDILQVVGGTGELVTQLKVTGVTLKVITSVSVVAEGAYTTVPADPVSVIGGSGNDDATFNLTSGLMITQPDVTSIVEQDYRWYLAYEV
jgi:hypothetical protein